MASLRHLFVLAPAVPTPLYEPNPPQQSSGPPLPPPPTSSLSRPTTTNLTHDEPPRYTSSEQPPTYSRPLPRPRQTYRLRQFGRNNQSFVPLGDFSSTTYSLQTKGFSSFLPSRPDMVFSTSRDGKTKSKSCTIVTILAKASFARTGELPWQPRASITLTTALSAEEEVIAMALDRKTSSQWSTTIVGIPHSWYLCLRPYRLVLLREGSNVVADAVAVFTYGERGTYASGGQAVGELSIVGAGARNDGSGLDEPEGGCTRYLVEIMLSCGIVIAHWRNQGKVFYNE